MEYDSAGIELDYEILAHNLTVAIRAIWSDEELNDSQKIERMKWINEVMHRVVLKSAALRVGRNECSEADTWEMMLHYISLCPNISAHIAIATINSYQAVDRQDGAA
jgi:hypothetical protein